MTVRIGSYTLGRAIGRGGNATVYAARQDMSLGTSRLVALKILHRSALPTDAEGPEHAAFRREAQLATRLEHPGIIRTYDVGVHDGQMVLAMELVLGAPLASVPGALALPLFTRIFVDIARAVHHAHELRSDQGTALGLVHQDLTPENVMLGYDGRVTLLDFGVARLVAIDASRTDTVRGKPGYLSPEQLEGTNIDRRTDIFALGVLAYGMLSGKPLFQRDSVAATYRAILLEPIADLNSLRADVPLAMASAIHRALSRDRDARWATAADFAGAIEEAARGARIARADDAAVGELVAAAVPQALSAADLEAEIGRASEATLDEPAVTRAGPIGERPPTLDALLHSETMPVVPVARLTRPLIAVFVALALVIGLVFLLRSRASASPQNVVESTPDAAASVALADAEAPVVVVSTYTAAPLPSPSASAHIVRGRTGRDRRPVDPPPEITAAAAAAVAPEPPHGGFLNVWSNVWGHVELDGRAVGDSPVKRLPVTAGAHQLKVSTQRGEQTRSVTVGADQDASERFVF